MITVILPDNSTRTLPAASTGLDLATSISKTLAKKAVALKHNGEMRDLTRTLDDGAAVSIILRDSAEGLEVLRHDAAHVLAQAVKQLFPETQVTIGPAIEHGFYYDFYRETPFTPDDLPIIEKRMQEIVSQNLPLVREEWARDDAVVFFKNMGEHFKAELIESIPAGQTITLYRQGDFIDLCRGPHLPTTGALGTAFKLTSIAGAYWRGDSNNAQLQRIYGTAWDTQEALDAYLKQLEEAEKRDHRRLGKQMDLFHFAEEAPGAVFWHAKGWTLFQTILHYMQRKISHYGYEEVNTPQMLDAKFWQASGHWDKYRENMFVIEEEEAHQIALKPMSCPGNIQLYKTSQKSYRDLPIRMAEFGRVFRREASGARHGLMRVQAFTQDDAHIFCTDAQLEDEVVQMCDLIKEVYTDLGLAENLIVRFSTRPEHRIGNDADWDRAESALQKVCERLNLPWVLNAGDGAFYAPKLDFAIKDAIGRVWQCGTIQVDMNLPHRLGLSYVGEDGAKHVPHMVHRAILGSLERFIGVLLEHYAGNLPLWLAPTQVVVASITNEVEEYARKVSTALKAAGLRVVEDYRNEKIPYKIREHSLAKVPVIIAVGKKEAEENTVSIRRLGQEGQTVQALNLALEALTKEGKAP
jgi:threonyl-tRNA synthetase